MQSPIMMQNASLTLSVLDLGTIIKKAVDKQGMLGWQFNPVGVSDAITMGNEGVCSTAA